MAEMIHLPSPQQANQHLAAGKGKSAAAPADAAGAQPFAAVLRGKCDAGAKPAGDGTEGQGQGQTQAQAPSQDGAETGTAADAAGQVAATETAAPAVATAPGDPAAMLAAALLATAPRPPALRAIAAGTATATGEAAATAAGGDTRAWLAQLTADAKRPGAGKDAAAGITAPAAGAAAAGVPDQPESKAGAAARTDFSELLGQARTESTAMNSTQTSSTDLAASTLAMLQPAREAFDAQRAAAPRAATQIEAPVGSPLFAGEAAQRVTWLARNGIEHAEIRVTPPDMGPIQVSIDIQHNEASINFIVTQTDTRVALEDSLHQLEEMLAESGIALSQASVGQQDAGQSFAGGQSTGTGGRGAPRGGPGGVAADLGSGLETRRPPQARGLVDTFA